MLEQPDSLYLAVKFVSLESLQGFPIPTPLLLSSALAQFGMMQRNLISFQLQCMHAAYLHRETRHFYNS